MCKFLAGASALALLAIPARSLAEAAPLAEVVVTAPASSLGLSALPTTAQSIDAATIARTVNVVTPEDVLRYLPNVLIRQRHIGDTQSPVTTRTSGVGASARSLIYVDGMLISSLIGNNNTSASPKWGLVSPDAIARVDVLYGPFAAAYAGNSIGSVIRFTTRMPQGFEAGAVERLHQIAKLIERPERILARAVGRVRCEEGDGRITPIVNPAGWAVLNVEVKYGKQFDRSDAKFLEVGDLLDHASVGATLGRCHPGTRMAGKPAHMHLVNDRLYRGPTQGGIAFPVIGARVHHDAFHRSGGIATGPARGFAAVIGRYRHTAAIRIQQHLGRIKAHSPFWIGRPMHPIAIKLAHLHSRHVRVPVMIRPVGVWIQFN